MTADNLAVPAEDLSRQVQSTNLNTRLPFGYAKRFGVLIEGKADQLLLLHREGGAGWRHYGSAAL